MKTMIYSLALAAFMSLSSCNDNDDPILTQKDWDGTATYFGNHSIFRLDTHVP